MPARIAAHLDARGCAGTSACAPPISLLLLLVTPPGVSPGWGSGCGRMHTAGGAGGGRGELWSGRESTFPVLIYPAKHPKHAPPGARPLLLLFPP